jgi:RNA polymerase sigma factor (sigma-70 family)
VKQKSDAQLVVAARTGDKAAFGELIERYRPTVHRLAWKMVGHEQLAQELTQEALLQAYLSLDYLRDDGRFRSWLYGITLNLCRSSLRRHQADVMSLEELMGGMSLDYLSGGSFEPSPEEVVEERELHRLVLKAVESLSPKNRAATLLFYYEELNLQETAALLNISIAAVKGRLHKARRQLSTELSAIYTTAYADRSIETGRNIMIKVKIADLIHYKIESDDVTEERDHRIIVLHEEPGQRILTIWIGPDMGEAIAHTLLNRTTRRPMTFTFMATLLKATGVELEEVRVETLKDDTFYAIAKLRNGDQVYEVDARPSDAICLALQTGCPIYVAEEVMTRAGHDISAAAKVPAGKGLAEIEQMLEERYQAEEARLERMRQRREALTEEEKKEGDARRHQEILDYILNK